jgi:ubiquinone biosynthesis protein Coq4
MADDTTKKSYDQMDAEYMEGKRRPLDEYGSILMTSSKFLNSARLRDIYAQEGLRKNGYDVPVTYMVHQANKALEELQDRDHVEALLAEEKTKKPDLAAWLDARVLSDFTLDELKDCKPGTLGQIVHDYFASQPGFELNFTNRALQPTTDFNYMQKQRTLAHDIEHIVSGLGPNPVGEFALIACNLSAYYRYFSPELAGELSRMTGFLLSTGLMKINLHYPQVMGVTLEGIQKGIAMGERLKRPLLVTNWRNYIHMSMEDVRADLGVVDAPPAGTWDWTSQARRG